MTRSSTRRDTTTAELRDRLGGKPPTSRQLRLLELLSFGATQVDAARVLGITVNSMKIHARRLYARLGADNAAQAVRAGFERGLLVPNRWMHVVLPEDDLEDEDES